MFDYKTYFLLSIGDVNNRKKQYQDSSNDEDEVRIKKGKEIDKDS